MVSNESLGALFLSLDDVSNGISLMKVNLNSGPDKIPSFVLKQCNKSLPELLRLIFNLSLSSGVFLDEWKVSFISPIFKSGLRHKIENYRGISKISAIPKLFEQIVKQKLDFHIKELISPSQHGFMTGKSTTTNLALFTNYVFR